MDISAKYRLGIWAVVILVIMNMALMAVLWYDRLGGRPPAGPREGRPDPEEFFVRELGLNDQQADSLSALILLQVQENEQIKAQIHALRVQLTQELFRPVPDTLRMRELAYAVGVKQAEMDMSVNRYFGLVKQICTPEQTEKLEHLVLEALNRSLRPPQPPLGGPGQRPGPADDRRPPPPPGGGR